MNSSEWREEKLGNVCEINTSTYSQKDNWSFINYLDTGNITENRIDTIQYLDSKVDKIPSRAKRKVFKNDIIYSTVRPNQKHYGIIKEPIENMLVSTGFAVINGKPNEIENMFLYYYLTQQHIIDSLHTIGEHSTSAYPSIKPSDIECLDLPLPTLPEQKAIAATLSCLDDKIELNNRMNKNLEEMAQAVFKSWFVDFEPFQDGEFEESELGMIPKGWRVVELSEISTVQNGFAFKSSDYQDSGCNMIRTTNIDKDGFVNNIDLIKLPYDFLTDKKYGNFKFQEFDTVLVMVGASVGKIGMITAKNIPALQNQNMWRFRPTLNSVSPIYIHYLVKITNDKVKNWSSGSARDFYRKDSFQNSKCLLPTEEVMNGFERIANPIFKLISKNLSENENLISSRDNLLPKLMSGEIRVPIEEVQ